MHGGNNLTLFWLDLKKTRFSSSYLYLPEAGIPNYIGDGGSQWHTSCLEDKRGIGVSGKIYSSELNTLK